jgi:cytosine/adenosine deaminase-related metal-dependent hydrolase
MSAPAMLIQDGCVYPADAEHRVIPHGSVLIMDNRIAAVGTLTQVEEVVGALKPAQRAGMETIDARRMMVLPGFVNAHWHELFSMQFPLRGALRAASDRDDRPGLMGNGGDLLMISRMFDSFTDLIDRMHPDEAEVIARYSLWTQLRSGVTTLGDAGSLNRPDAMVIAARQLGIRFMVSMWASDAICASAESRPRRTRDADDVLGQLETLLQSCSADRTGRIRCLPSIAYVINMTDELGAGFAELVHKHEMPYVTHVGALRNETAVMQHYYGVTGLQRLFDLGLLTDRLVTAHCAFVHDAERRLLMEADVHISHFPAKYGMSGESTLTETRVIPELRRAGLDVSLATDGAPLPITGMAEVMRAAWQMYNEMYADQTEVLPTDALAMATRIAAKGLRWDDEIGSLEPGKQADLVLIRTDDWRYLLNPRPLESFLALGGSTDVDTVIVSGQVLLSGGRAIGLDEDELQECYLNALRSFTTRCLDVSPDAIDAAIETARALT